ncbi:GTP-binding protein [Oricola sp.]|uniref:CobW family GTP-binding protein n=1 Tax=Oricola sp. TaxID=1979950 RepID=UPI0025E2D344|nr:GTP-binding protein [Oricola sp.]MCI5075199.1 GTP-binding protein [Oricola sp.]
MPVLPVHVVTGFLGAGKTTLLNRLIGAGGFANTAVIINEFGDVGIDHLLVEAAEGGEPMIELSDGCLCCTVRSDLVDTLFQIAARVDAGSTLDRVVIETTGLADPAPVLQAVMATPGLNERFRVASLVTVVCAATGLTSLREHDEARSQVALADRIVLTKTDMTPPSEELLAAIAALNPMVTPVDSRADGFALVLDDAAVSAADLPEDEPHGHHHHHHDVNRHDATIEAFTLTHDRPIPASTVEMFIDLLRSSMPRQLLRMKGIVRTVEDPERPLVVHGVQSVFHPPVRLDGWGGRTPQTRLVVITKNGNRAHVEGLFAAFTGQIAPDRPDAQALTNNPLAIPGM